MKFAIFDVDLTLTKKDTFIEFYKFLCKEDKRFYAYFNKAIFSGLMYVLKIYDEKKSKEQYLSFLNGICEDVLNRFARKFFYEYLINELIYRDAIIEIEKRKSEGYVIILISASPEFYLKYFNELSCIDYVLGTRYEIINGFYTGKMIGFNNKGREKVFRFRELLFEEKIRNYDFDSSIMYSDSLHDLPMFSIVGTGFLINSNKRVDKLINLNWN